MAACRKTIPPWLDRIEGQLCAAYAVLETELVRIPLIADSNTMTQAGITVAVAWQFTQSTVAKVVPASKHPAIQAFADSAERLPEFIAFPPVGPGVPRN